MKKILVFLLLMCISQTAFAGMVKGYYRKDGTYVPPHYRNTSTKSYSTTKKTYPYTKTNKSKPYIKRTYRMDGAMGF